MSDKSDCNYSTITPHVALKDAAKAIDYYKNVFGAEEIRRLHTPAGTIMHADLKIGESHLFVCDPMGECGQTATSGRSPVTLHLHVADVDSAFAKAVEHGATVVMPLQNMFWGARYGQLTDPFGQTWSLAQQIEELSTEEMQKRGDAFMKEFAASKK